MKFDLKSVGLNERKTKINSKEIRYYIKNLAIT
jgi:hypothetical protein